MVGSERRLRRQRIDELEARSRIADPQGRKVGFDPTTLRSFAEIQGAVYDSSAGLSNVSGDGTFGPDDEDQPKEIDVPFATTGAYTVDVIGTDFGSYELSNVLIGNSGRSAAFGFRDIPISAGERHRYAFMYNPQAVGVPGREPVQSGAFSGGGQSADADGILTYARPGERQSTLATGTTRYSLLIFYSPSLVAASFSAELNGVDVSSSFNPVQGGFESVEVLLNPGRNVLKLRADGQSGTRVVSDADNLVFLVP